MLATIVLSALLLIVVALAARSIIKNHRSGGCSGGCQGCALSCHEQEGAPGEKHAPSPCCCEEKKQP